jgi:hypothetical protein
MPSAADRWGVIIAPVALGKDELVSHYNNF